MNALVDILKDVRANVEARARLKPISPAEIVRTTRHSLVRAIERAPGAPIIAEVKRSSPSAGSIRPRANPVEVALSMLRGGAVSLSVLTEPKHFAGDPEFLREIRKFADVPLLYKGFIVDDYQIYEAAQVRADAVLLIVKVLGGQLSRFMKLASKLGLESLVEVTNEDEVRLAQAAGARLIGINNRDLQTLDVDLNRTVELAPLISENKTIVSESGIKTSREVRMMLDAGADAVLIGTAIMMEKDIEKKVRSLVNAR